MVGGWEDNGLNETILSTVFYIGKKNEVIINEVIPNPVVGTFRLNQLIKFKLMFNIIMVFFK